MANNLIDLPKIEDMTSSVFGKVDPFAQQKATTATSLLGDFVKDANKPIELSAGAQKMVTEGLNAAQNVIELSNKTNAAIQNQIEASQAQQAAALKQQQAIQQQRVEQEKLRQAAIKEQEAKQKELEKELKEKIKADPLKVAQPRANVLLNSPEYKAASTEKKKDMVASFLANQKTALAAEIKDPDLQTAIFNETQGLLYSQLNKDVDAIVNDGSHFFSDLKTSVASFSKGLLGGYEGSKASSISKDIDAIKSGTSAISNGNLLSETTRRQLTNYTIADKPLPQPLRNTIVNELAGKLTEQTAKADRYFQQQKDIKEGYSAEVKDSLANLGYTKAKKELELAKEGKQLTLAGQISEGIGAAKDNWYALSLDSITPMLASIGTGLIMRNAPAAATIAASSTAGGLFTSSDVVSSARDAILSADDAQLKRIKGWDAALAQAGGNKELARRNIATVAANDKAGVGFLIGAALSVFGPETLASLAVGKVLSRGAAQAAVGSAKTAVAKNAGLFGAGIASEGLEEGATQYLANVAAAEADPMKDVGYNAGIGGVLGGVMSAAPTIASTTVDVLNARALNPNAGPTPSGQPPVSGDVLSDLVNERVGLLQNLADAGKLDTSSINKVLYEGLERIPSEVSPQGGAATGYSGRQAFFDAVYESDILQNRLTPAQQAEIKSYIATAFSDINTNPYDYAAKTAELLAFYASDANSASSDMTKDAIAVKTNNGAAIVDPVLATATAQALQAIDPNINESTKERMLRWTTMIRPDIYERNPDLTEEQKNQLDRYMHDYIDVTPRRMTDAQVAQQQAGLNQVPPSAQPVAGQPTQVQPLMGTNVPGTAAASSAQGSGNNLAQQTFTPTNLIQPAPQTSQSPSGSVAQSTGGNPVGQASQVAAAPTASSGPLIGTGTTGQTNSIQPVGQSGPSAAPTPVSSGSAAAAQAKRNANAQRPSTSNQGTQSVTLANGTTVTAPTRPIQTIELPSGNTAIESVATQRAAETTATTADTTEAPATQEVTRYSSGPIQLDDATAEVTRPTAPVPPTPPQPTAPDAFDITLSASTYSIPGLRRLQQRVDAGDTQAATLLHYVARDMLTRLTGAIDGVELSSVDSYGLYKGDKEPSLGITVTVTNPDAIPELLAALAKFADNFNQQQVHVREDTDAEVGYEFGDGSFATPVYRVALNEPLSDTELNRIMTESGLVGLTANEQYLEFYYVGEVGSEKANEQIDEFFNSAERAQQLLGAKSSGVRRKTQRLYIYGEFGGIPYNQIASGLRTQSAAPESVTARRIAEDQVGRTIEPAPQQDITPQQRALQTQIRDDYEAMPMDDLSNPLVQRAYTELADEVKDQFLSMPIKVDLLSGQGEPYASSTEMRRDILDNNHLSIFATEPDTFGSDPSIDYSNHPLLQPSGIKILDADGNIVEEGEARYNESGKELLYNDLFRAVHDYYAHTVSPVAFGPKGEEAAWKNHMAMMRSPWAAWALTTETRGQNSWVNFSPGMENRPIQERPFAPQKTGLLPLQYSYTGNAQVDAKLDTLKTELSANEQQGSLATPEPTTEPDSTPAPLETTTVDAVSESTPADTREFSSYTIKAVGNKKSLGDMNVSLSIDAEGNIYITYGRGVERTTEVFDTKRKAVNFILRNDIDPDMMGDVDRRDYVNTFIMGDADSARNALLSDRKEDDAATILGADVALPTATSADTVQESDNQRDTAAPTEARLDTVTPNQIKAAFARKLLTSEEKASLGVGELKGADLVAHVTDLLTSPQENLTDVQNSALDKIAGYVDKGFADRQLNRQKANRNTDESAGQKTVADVITTQERDVVDAFLESRNEEDVTAEDLVEQVISNRVNRDAPTDPLIVAAEADSRIKRIVDRIWNAIKNTVAVVAVALAAYTGMANSNDAYAATTPINVTSPIATLTQDANAARQYVQQNGDNANKPYIIADKKGGAVHLFDAQGNLLATTPALFGKNISDTTRAGATPAGKFTIKYASTPAKGYGGTVQALANSSGQLVQSSIGTVSIHRTYTANSAENRPARLASKSVTDNRVSNGCINVPSSFYDAHLDSAFDGYVYVLPETKASPYRPRGSDITTTTQRATELRAPTRAEKTIAQTTVPASAVIAAQAAAEPVVTETISTAPIIIEGTKPSGQVAMVKPVAVNEVSHSTMNVPQGTHTPLEQSTKPAFDTVAPDVTTESGWDIAGVVLGVLGSLGVGGIIVQNNRRARRLTSRRNATQPTLAQLQAPAAQQTPAAAIAATVAPQASITPPAAPSPVPATPTTSAAQQFKVNELASAMHQAQWFDYMTRVGGLDEAVLQDLFFAETNLFRTMTDKSLQQALENDLQAKPWNVGDSLPGKLKGALGTIIYLTNGAKPALDNLLIKYGAPVVGVESDSPRFSMLLSAIGGMANAAVREMTTANITPITKKLEKLSYKYRKGFQEVAEDFGRYATLDHLLSEGFNEHIRAKEGEIDTYVQIMALQDAIIADPNSSAREVSAAQADRDIAARNRTRLENQLLIIRSTIDGTTAPIDRAAADQHAILTAHQTAMQAEVTGYNQTIAAQDAVLSNPNASAKDKNTASKAKNSAIAKRDALTKRIDDIQDTLDSLPFTLDPALLQQATANVNSAQRADEVRQATTKLSQLVNARSKLVLDANNNVLWNGDTDANGNVVEGQVKMPGGYTRNQAQQEFDRLKSMYDIADLESTAADIVKAYNRATIFAGASGVYRASDYERFKDIGFKKYVALYRKSLTPADLNPTNEENVESSELADLLRKYPTRQVLSLGLQDDVTRYSRDGSSEPAADAYTNLLLFTRQHGSLIAQAPLRREIELLYEGTWQNVNQTGVFSTKRLEELEQKGEIPGIVRYLPGKEPANLKDVRPISAWGHIADANGEQQYVRMNYYFTDTVIQEQIGRNITLGESADGNGLLGGIMAETRAYTRFASQLMTRFNPRFQLFTNVFNETWERATTAAFRDVVDVNGDPVSVTSLIASHAAHVAENMTIGKRREIYRYITTGEVKTKLQYILHEMYGRGAIHLQTDLVEKQNMMEEYKKALSTRALDAAGNRLKRLANKSEVVGSAVDMSEDALDFMLMQLSEVTQVALVLASAQAYIDNGVNLAEASNRVRDSFDAMRAPNWQTKMGALFPFVRATMSGVYNNIRSLTQTEGQASKVAGVIVPKYITSMALLLATNLTLLGLAASLLGDDDDDDNGNGTPLLAKLPSTAFKQGVPLPNPFGDGIIYLPVGHGIGSAMWQMAASLYRTANGTNDTAGLMGDLTTTVVENTLPIQLANSKLFGDEMGDWAVLSMTPQMLKPIVELATNRNSFTGAEIVRATTPRGERDSAQGNFKMPQGYRDLAAGLYDVTFGAVDMRPETIQHLSKGYFGYGPLRALDASFQDLSEATGGTRERRSEQAGSLAPIAALMGFGTFVDNQSLQADILSFGVQDKAYSKLAQYGVELTDPNNKPGEAINTIVNKLIKESATPADIVFIKNTLEFTKDRKALEKQFAEEAKAYNEQRAKGVPADATRMQTLQANIDILTRNYVKENSKYE